VSSREREQGFLAPQQKMVAGLDMNCVYDFFASIGSGWINMATIVGALVGIAISIYAILFSKKLSDESTIVAASIRANTDAIQKQTAAIHNHTRILRLDNLRNLCELSRGDERRHSYWHFRWRFETYDVLGGQIQTKDGEDVIFVGHCDLRVEGFSNRPEQIGFEGRESEFYTAKIANIEAAEGQTLPFQNGDVVACFDQNGELMISKGVDPWTMEPKFIFMVVRLGPFQHGHGERTIGTLPVFPRIKDS
jgi:hypothetical protein